ncbi:MAG: hypothetical protein JNM43_21315 [Planctomycetaceae bacterium]|nr:hypothetical protein [Planctomycetaceae bacterium]
MARRQHQNSITLFPFLAVLVCAMGSLILLLLVMTRKIRHDQQAEMDQSALVSAAELPPDRSAELSQLQAEIQAIRSSIEERNAANGKLRAVLEERQTEVEKQQSELTGLLQKVDATTASSQSPEELAASVAQLKDKEAELLNKLSKSEKALLEKRERLAEAEDAGKEAELLLHEKLSAVVNLRKQVDEAKRKAMASTGTETLLEFSNATGTSRVPIVIDITKNGFEFLPNGIRITPADMESFPVRDNPLLSALLAIHKYRSGDSLSEEPYVLLLVRPDGCLLFYGAQRILVESKIHYGYELLEADRVVETGTPDLNEPPLVQVAIGEAFRRRENLYAKLMAIAQQHNPNSPLPGDASPGDSPTKPQDRKLAVRPDGRVVEEEPQTRRRLEGRYYAGGVAPPSTFFENRAAARTKGAPVGRLSAEDAERMAEEFAATYARQRALAQAAQENSQQPQLGQLGDTSGKAGPPGGAQSAASQSVIAATPSQEPAGAAGAGFRSPEERRFSEAIFGGDGSLHGSKLIGPGSTSGLSGRPGGSSSANGTNADAGTFGGTTASGTTSNSQDSYASYAGSAEPSAANPATASKSDSVVEPLDWYRSKNNSSTQTAANSGSVPGQSSQSQQASKNGGSLLFAGEGSGAQGNPDLSKIDPELLKRLNSAGSKSSSLSTPVGIVVFLDEGYMTVAQQSAVPVTEDNMDQVLASLLKGINTEVEDAKRRPMEPMMPVVKFIVSPGGEKWRVPLARNLRNIGIRTATFYEVTPYIVNSNTNTSGYAELPEQEAVR